METPEAPGSGARLSGRLAFQHAVREAIEQAADHGLPWMFWCDLDFADWPLKERAVVETLQRWALGGGRLRMLASDFRGVQQHAARFVTWRRQWDHRFEARSSGRSRGGDTPCVLLTPEKMLLRLAPEAPVFVWTSDRARRTQMADHLESLWQQSVSAFPATTLGL